MNQTIVLADGTRLEGPVVSWEDAGRAIITVRGRRYCGERAEVHAKRVSRGIGPKGTVPARTSIRSQPQVVA